MSSTKTTFTNCRICEKGRLEHRDFGVSSSSGCVVDVGATTIDSIDLGNAIIAPGFIELQTNGVRGFHFTNFEDGTSYAKSIDGVANYLPSTGVTGFYVTIPTVATEEFKKV